MLLRPEWMSCAVASTSVADLDRARESDVAHVRGHAVGARPSPAQAYPGFVNPLEHPPHADTVAWSGVFRWPTWRGWRRSTAARALVPVGQGPARLSGAVLVGQPPPPHRARGRRPSLSPGCEYRGVPAPGSPGIAQ